MLKGQHALGMKSLRPFGLPDASVGSPATARRCNGGSVDWIGSVSLSNVEEPGRSKFKETSCIFSLHKLSRFLANFVHLDSLEPDLQ